MKWLNLLLGGGAGGRRHGLVHETSISYLAMGTGGGKQTKMVEAAGARERPEGGYRLSSLQTEMKQLLLVTNALAMLLSSM